MHTSSQIAGSQKGLKPVELLPANASSFFLGHYYFHVVIAFIQLDSCFPSSMKGSPSQRNKFKFSKVKLVYVFFRVARKENHTTTCFSELFERNHEITSLPIRDPMHQEVHQILLRLLLFCLRMWQPTWLESNCSQYQHHLHHYHPNIHQYSQAWPSHP